MLESKLSSCNDDCELFPNVIDETMIAFSMYLKAILAMRLLTAFQVSMVVV